MPSSSAVGRGMSESPGVRNPGKFAVSILPGVMILGASVVPSMGATYSADPAPGNFKDVGVGYRFRVSSISAGVATFEVLPKTGTFGFSGRAVIKTTSINGTIVGTGIPYAAGASTAGSIAVDISAAGLTSGSMDFFAVREGDTNVWDGPITVSITGENENPTVGVSSASMESDGDLVVTWTANDDLTASIGTDLYISVNDDLNAFSFPSKQTPANSTNGVIQTYTFPASFLATLGMNPGGTHRVRVNVFDGSDPQLSGLGYSPTFVFSLPAIVRPDVAVGSSPVRLVGRGVFSPRKQSVTIQSRRALPVRAYATLANLGTKGDSLIATGARSNSFFNVKYTVGGANITGQLTTGKYRTPVIARSNAAILIRTTVTPNQSKLRKKNGRGGFTTEKRTFTATIRARATSDASLGDSAVIVVRTR